MFNPATVKPKRIIFSEEEFASRIAARRISVDDVFDALRMGWHDFREYPSFAILAALIYPTVGVLVARILHGYSFITLLFPLAAGFALLGPFAGLMFSEVSRRRETGRAGPGGHNLNNLPSLIPVLSLAALLAVIFISWIATSQAVYNSFYGFAPAFSMSGFMREALTTPEGHRFLLETIAVGFGFAALVFSISVVSVPALLDKDLSMRDALLTSFLVLMRNPVSMALWASIIVALLAASIVPAFLGLAVTVPVLGHASWHLYRKTVV